MEPLGTITNYFKFFDSETRSLLNDIMGEALHYADFVNRLCYHVCSKEVSRELVFFAFSQGMYARDTSAKSMIIDRYNDDILLIPFFVEEDKIIESIEKALALDPDDWIKFHLLIQRWYYASGQSIGSFLEDETIEKIERSIQENNDLAFLKPYLTNLRAITFRKEGNISKAIDLIKRTRDLAIKFNNTFLEMMSYGHHAYVLRNFDTLNALQLLDRAEEISEKLGISSTRWDDWNTRGGIHNTRGEYNAAIDCYLEALERLESLGIQESHRLLPNNIAGMYIYIGEFEEALEWGKMGIESSVRNTVYPSLHVEAHIRIATALNNMGKFEEGIAHLDFAKKMSLSRASEKSLLEIYIASGFLERMNGDIETSIIYFKKALEICERKSWQHKINVCLTRLAESEIMQFTHFEQSKDDTGPWLTRLETISREKDLPGILGLALLLKAELRLNQGRVDDAYNILEEAIEISKNPGTKFLEKKIAKLILTAFPEQS